MKEWIKEIKKGCLKIIDEYEGTPETCDNEKEKLNLIAEIESCEEEIEALNSIINSISKDMPTPDDVKEAYFRGVDEGRPK